MEQREIQVLEELAKRVYLYYLQKERLQLPKLK